MKIIAAADGSALGNPGPAGWGWYVSDQHWAAGGWPHGTNNMGELMAVLDVIQQTAHLDTPLHILCDSQYVIQSVTKWMAGWKRNGWKKKDGKPVLNGDLMRGIDEAMVGRDVTFEWVKGHSGHPLNEKADDLANGAARAHQEGRVPSPGPGFSSLVPVRLDGDTPPTLTASPAAKRAPRATPGAPGPDLFSLFDDDDLPSAGAAEPSAAETPIDRVIALETSLLDSAGRGDRDRVADSLHADWEGISATGTRYSRASTLAELTPLSDAVACDIVSGQFIDANTVLLLWRSASQSPSHLRSSIWVRSGARWVQRFHQETPQSG